MSTLSRALYSTLTDSAQPLTGRNIWKIERGDSAMASIIIKTELHELGDHDSAAQVLKTIVAEHARTLHRSGKRKGSSAKPLPFQPQIAPNRAISL